MKPKATLRHYLLLAASSLLAISHSQAAVVNWDGSASADWSAAANWDTDPSNIQTIDTANFNLATYGGDPVFNPNAGTTSINGITIGALNGTMTLTTTNLTIGNSGIVIANGAGAFGVTGGVMIGAAQSWTNDSATTFTVSGLADVGANTLTLDGTGDGLTTLTGGLSLSGAGGLVIGKSGTLGTTISGGTITLGGTGGITINNGSSAVSLGAATVSAVQSWANNSSTAMTTAGILAIDNQLSLTAGTFTFGNFANTGTGGGVINGTTAQAGNDAAFGTGTLTLTSGTLSSDGGTARSFGNALAINGSVTLGDATNNGALTFTGAKTITGSNTITLAGSGGATFSTAAMSLADGSNTTFSSASGALALSGGFNTDTGTKTLTFDTGTNAVTMSGALTGSGTLVLAGSGTNVTVGALTTTANAIQVNSTTGGVYSFNGASTFTGGVTLTSGKLNINSVGAAGTTGPLGNGGTFAINGGTIDNTSGSAKVVLNVNPITVGGNFAFSTGGGTASNNLTLPGTVNLGGSTRTITTNGTGILTLSGIVSNGGLTKAGTGTLTLTGTKTYTGATTVNQGTLFFSNTSDLPTTLITNNSAVQFYSDGGGYSTAAKLTGGGTWTVDGPGGGSIFDKRVILKGTGSDNTGSISVINSGKLWVELTASNNPIGDTSDVSIASGAIFNLYGSAGAKETIGGLNGSGTVDFLDGGGGKALTLELGGGDKSGSFSGSIKNTGSSTPTTVLSISKTGSGTQILSGTNTYTGTTTVSAGTLALSGGNNILLNTGAVNISNSAGTFDISAITTSETIGSIAGVTGSSVVLGSKNLTAGGNNSSTVFAGVISGTGTSGLTKIGTGTLTLGGSISNSYAGVTTLGSTGRLILAKTGGAIAIPGNISLSSTAWNGNSSGVVLAGSEQIADTSIITWTTTALGGGTQQDSFLRLNGYTETVGGLVSTGTVWKAGIENRGSGDTANYGTGTLIINTTGSNSYSFNGFIRDKDGGTGTAVIALTKTGTGTQTLSGSSSYTGGTRIDAGTLTLGHATDTLANTGAINVNGGTLALGTNTDTVGAVTLTSGSITGSGAGRLTGTSYGVQSGTISAKLGGSGALTKTTAGTVTISSDNSGGGGYTGAIAVNAGTLIVNGNVSTSITTVASGGTISGSGTTGTLTVQTGGFINPGNSPGILSTGNYAQLGLYTAEINGLTAGTQHDQINVTGTVNITGGSLATLFTGSYALNDMIFILLNDGLPADTITGTFAGLAQGATAATYGGFDWKISYQGNSGGSPSFLGGNDIVLQAIPEPNVAALIGGFGMLCLLRRRR